MSDRGRYNKGLKSAGTTFAKKGEWNAWCMRCGHKYKSSQLIKEWDELWVCRQCYEDRHPQDMVRGVVDLQAVPWASPELPDTFALNAAITGLTTAPFAPGSEVMWDYTNTLSVKIAGGALASSDPLSVMNGANLCAVMNSGVPAERQADTTQQTSWGEEVANPIAPSWEILQFTTATLTAPATYALTGLLRGRYGTEGAMNIGPLSAGSPFVFIGQASASNDLWIRGNLGWGALPISPVYIGGYNDSGDEVFVWIRRSRIPPLWQDDWAVIGLNDNFIAPMDETGESYEVDVYSGAGAVIRTIHAQGAPMCTYPLDDQIADFGAVQSAYSIAVYQTDPILGRGQGRAATVPVIVSPANDTLVNEAGRRLTAGTGVLIG